jgi:hypothetical protein
VRKINGKLGKGKLWTEAFAWLLRDPGEPISAHQSALPGFRAVSGDLPPSADSPDHARCLSLRDA